MLSQHEWEKEMQCSDFSNRKQDRNISVNLSNEEATSCKLQELY